MTENVMTKNDLDMDIYFTPQWNSQNNNNYQ